MVFSVEDHILIENLYKCKAYGAKRLIREFPDKGSNVSGLKKLRDTSTTARQSVIDKAIDQWRVRQRTCVKANGQHCEHLL